MGKLSSSQMLALFEIKVLQPYAYQEDGVWKYYNLYRPTVEALKSKGLIEVCPFGWRDGRVRITTRGKEALLDIMAMD